MLAVGFEPDKLSATVRELAGKDLGNHNQSTYDTVQTLIALVEYAKVSQELSPNYTYQILLDGKLIQEAKINSNNFRSKISPIEIGYNQINQGGSNLEFRKNGEGYLYYTTVVSEYKTYKTKVKDDQKIAITKTITGEGGKTSGFRTGDLVKVELEVENKTGSQIYYLVINDPLPAGMAAIDPRLENQTSNYSGFYYERDVRNDSAKFFPYSLTSGIKYKFSYSARVISAGNYQISPTSAYPMYEQEISGRSDNSSATFIQ